VFERETEIKGVRKGERQSVKEERDREKEREVGVGKCEIVRYPDVSQYVFLLTGRLKPEGEDDEEEWEK